MYIYVYIYMYLYRAICGIRRGSKTDVVTVAVICAHPRRRVRPNVTRHGSSGCVYRRQGCWLSSSCNWSVCCSVLQNCNLHVATCCSVLWARMLTLLFLRLVFFFRSLILPDSLSLSHLHVHMHGVYVVIYIHAYIRAHTHIVHISVRVHTYILRVRLYYIYTCTHIEGRVCDASGLCIFTLYLHSCLSPPSPPLSRIHTHKLAGIVSCFNIFLDWLFVGPWGKGVAGAAWATTIAQTLGTPF